MRLSLGHGWRQTNAPPLDPFAMAVTADTKDTTYPSRYGQDPVNLALTEAAKIKLLRDMLRIRRFEETANKYYSAGKMGGFLHLYIGPTINVTGINKVEMIVSIFITSFILLLLLER